MKLTIVIHHPHTTVKRFGMTHIEMGNRVFETLRKYGVSEEVATDCEYWCEVADAGDSYNAEDFDVYIENDDLIR